MHTYPLFYKYPKALDQRLLQMKHSPPWMFSPDRDIHYAYQNFVKRYHRAACIQRMQFTGLGVPNKHFATQNGVCIYRRIACDICAPFQSESQNSGLTKQRASDIIISVHTLRQWNAVLCVRCNSKNTIGCTASWIWTVRTEQRAIAARQCMKRAPNSRATADRVILLLEPLC